MKFYVLLATGIHLVNATFLADHPNGIEFAVGNNTYFATDSDWHFSLEEAEKEVANRVHNPR